MTGKAKKLPRKRKLSKAEEDWLIELELLLSNPPTKRIGFFTIGDKQLQAYDLRFEDEIHRRLDVYPYGVGDGAADFCGAVHDLGVGLFTVECKANIHSTAG